LTKTILILLLVLSTLHLQADPDEDLLNAVKQKSLRSVQKAVQKGANINKELDFPEGTLTPFHFAVIIGNVEIVKYFLDNKVNPNLAAKVKRGNQNGINYPVHLASGLENSKVLQLLVNRGANLQARSYLGTGEDDLKNISCLFFAVENNRVEIVKYLLKKGLDPNDIGQEAGKILTGLEIAEKSGSMEVIELLKKESQKTKSSK